MPRRKSSDSKFKALVENGTANPRPQDVHDPAFRESEFFDPRDLLQVRYEMLRRVRMEGHAVAETSKSFGVSRPTFYKAQTDFERQGLAGLVPAKRGPRGPHKVTDEVVAVITDALASNPDLDSRALAVYVEQRVGLHVHARTIERALQRMKKKRQ